MKVGRPHVIILGASVLALAAAIPAIGQERPESILPPGLGKRAPAPTNTPPSAPKSNPTPNQNAPSAPKAAPSNSPPVNAAPSNNIPSNNIPSNNSAAQANAAASSDLPDNEKAEEEEGDALEEAPLTFDAPPSARRSLAAIGFFTEEKGGFPRGAYGALTGKSLQNIINKINGPLVSRWGTIMTRRLLVSRTATPSDINGADLAGDRAWLLLRMGEADLARRLIQQVDSTDATKRLYQVAMPIYLANGDIAGSCSLVDSAYKQVDAPTWKMARPICASLAGEQGRAKILMNQARSQRWARGVDYLLAERLVGLGKGGGGAVKIEWAKVDALNAWRFGTAISVGIYPPDNLMQKMGRHTAGWELLAPMIPIDKRVEKSASAAALGTISNHAMVDLYSSILTSDGEASEASKALADRLETAYVANNMSTRLGAMNEFWKSAKNENDRYGMMVLTARAAALVPVSSSYSGDADNLIASMLTAGLDKQAARWASLVDVGSLGWGLIQLSSPQSLGEVSESNVDDFLSDDDSEKSLKTAFLTAGLAGLGRMNMADAKAMEGAVELPIFKQNKWTQAIDAAAKRGEAGSVAIIAAAGLQGRSWKQIPPFQLYYIVRALTQVGREAEARMIAAEAVTRA
ncbi:hypothetical protein LPB140_08960 [Sphingorhabdus lutea]|uniref:Uncharacterized protein n=1 Tax=Sphingorhabdus lutea TaxID=1913578 RepID=A0A1L3JCN9_9SPHN|nr:hypothetical protein [Sphingorhabdus lutea]APG62896.1 hypothetical protein LPB140_08960 [Sphingorhabdus lutea]